MSDNLDIASERKELARQAALSQRRPEGPSPTGRCLWCDDIVSDYARWCCADCRNQWETEARLKQKEH